MVDRREWPREAPLALPAGSREVEFHYTAPSFVAPDKVLFKYRLEGFDPDWVDAGPRRTAYFTNLAPRNYRFRVKACNSDGLWNEAGAVLELVVEPWFYQTLAFRLAVAALVLAAAWGAFRFRVRQLRAREQTLARQIDRALAEIKVLSGLLPICASCKRIRDDGGDWTQLESYIHQHSQAEFSHGLCPECARNLFPDDSANRPA